MNNLVRALGVCVVGLLTAAPALAWWNDAWPYRKQLMVQFDQPDAIVETPVLLRLHGGNFAYFLDLAEGGADLRFVAADDQTVLAHHIESLDVVNEIALIWVRVPVQASHESAKPVEFWMYYGNPEASDAQQPEQTYGVNEAARLHLTASPIKNATRYAVPVEAEGVALTDAGYIAGGADLTADSQLIIADAGPLGFDPSQGWTLSFWLRPQTQDTGAQRIFARGGAEGLTLWLDRATLRLEWLEQGEPLASWSGGLGDPAAWHHLAFVGTDTGVKVYLNGVAAGSLDGPIRPLGGALVFGASGEGRADGMVGQLDEIAVAGAARSAEQLRFAYRNQERQGQGLLTYGEDASQESDPTGPASYMGATLRNVSLEGWVVIGLLAVMAVVSWLVMLGKALLVGRARSENAEFHRDFVRLAVGELGALDRGDTPMEEALMDSPVLLALAGKHDHYQSSPMYRVYHAGVSEITRRFGVAAGADVRPMLSARAVETLRANIDSALVREIQRLNGQMVLLTIAISGGPFLGLLGTVIGVMITFAAIAVSGDVNVAAIAPGVAAALMTTVAGLFVAIPALFGYNYLQTRIRDITADLQMFVDEFIARVAEEYVT
ncbi:MAG: DUF2341 domain-containing protein [Pseudomonadota bacterium]|nr:DUF2341 domain-containing protein [Pseudomonadota bacterium]